MNLIVMFLVTVAGVLFTDNMTPVFRTEDGIVLFLCGMVTTLACVSAYDILKVRRSQSQPTNRNLH